MNKIDEKIEELKNLCKSKNMRLTPQRIEIYRTLLNSKEHPSAEMLYNQLKVTMPEISVDTIYRNLATLENLGFIFRVDNQLERARFDADQTPHHHFLCTGCGEVYDIFDNVIDLSGYETNIGIIKNSNIQFCGICNKCLEQKGDK